jgi:enoyl-CoA hydratase/carnithine racemase
VHEVGAAELLEALGGSHAAERYATEVGGAVLVRVRPGDPAPDRQAVAQLTSLPLVVIAVHDGDAPAAGPTGWAALADVSVAEGDPVVHDVVRNLAEHPRAAVTLVLLLRGVGRRSLDDGLVAESAAYSLLQAGPEFAAWRAEHEARARPDDDGPRLRVERDGDRLCLTLARPEVRNALDARMRDELVEALELARADATIATIELRGEGPSFCAGGDLDEFGRRPDPATAHLVRLHRSPARALAAVADRVVAHVHGPCAGSGVELPAFCHRVVAHPDTTFVLPEVSLGLVPGAGGTASLPARIGRTRTALLGLSARPIDAETALAWGLVDELD